MSRKAQGLSMNVIIIAAIALLVLVILAVIFIGRMRTTTSGIDQCKGSCDYSSESECQQNLGTYAKATNDPCMDSSGKRMTDKVCCVSV